MSDAELVPLLTAEEVAELFGVEVNTAKCWARNKPEWIGAIRTPGGHWRFKVDIVMRAWRGRYAGQA